MNGDYSYEPLFYCSNGKRGYKGENKMDDLDNKDEGIEEEGAEDGSGDEANQADNNDGSVEEEGSNSDAGTEGENAEGTNRDNAEGSGQDNSKEEFAKLNENYEKLKLEHEELSKRVNAPSPAAAPKVRTEEEWNQLAGQTGLPKEGLQYIEFVRNEQREDLKKATIAIAQYFNGKLATRESDDVINVMSKEKPYADINQYREGIRKYLSKYDPSLHNRRDMIEDGYWIAKGRGADKAVKKMKNSNELNRRVSGVARPGSGASNGGSRNNQSLKLNNQERQAYEMFGKNSMTEEEYAKSLPRFRNK